MFSPVSWMRVLVLYMSHPLSPSLPLFLYLALPFCVCQATLKQVNYFKRVLLILITGRSGQRSQTEGEKTAGPSSGRGPGAVHYQGVRG